MSATPPVYDSTTKIWHQALKNPTLKISLGQFILNKLDEFDPNKIIEINYDNDKKLRAGELKKLMVNCAKNFTDLGVKQNDRIALFTTMNSYTTPLVYGAYVIGACVTPMDNLLTDDINEMMFKQLDPNIIIYDEEFKNRVFNIIQKLNFTNLKLTLSADSESDKNSVPNLISKNVHLKFEIPIFSNPNKVLGAILLTSGSTGAPKQIMISHSQLALMVDTWWWPGAETVNIYVACPFRWVSQYSAMLQPIFNRSTRIFTRKNNSAELCFDVIQKYRVTHFFSPIKNILNLLNYTKQKEGQHFQTIQYVMTAGEKISLYVEKSIQKYIPQARLIRVYGMTELAGCISTNFCNKDETNGPGYLVSGLSLKIIDDDDNSLDINCNGRICVKAAVPSLGYWNDVKSNKKSFLNDWFITGDYGKVDSENKLHIYNRCKDLIFFEKKMIIPSIIEQILDNHPAVDVCYIIGIPIGQGSKEAIPVAFLKLRSDSKNLVTAYDILAYLKSNVQNQIYLKHIYFITEIPIIPCGKVDKNKLRSLIEIDME